MLSIHSTHCKREQLSACKAENRPMVQNENPSASKSSFSVGGPNGGWRPSRALIILSGVFLLGANNMLFAGDRYLIQRRESESEASVRTRTSELPLTISIESKDERTANGEDQRAKDDRNETQNKTTHFLATRQDEALVKSNESSSLRSETARKGAAVSHKTNANTNGASLPSVNEAQMATLKKVPQDGIAACIMLLEDSVQLIEWIAFHYTTLPLSSLIVGLDPKNSNRTVRVLNELFANWNETVGLEIQTWHYPDYMDPNQMTNPKRRADRQDTLEFMWRQKSFVNKCSQHHKQAGREWTIATDSDEFLVYNYMNPIDEDLNKTDSIYYNLSKPIRQELPQFRNRTVLDFLRHYEHLYDQNQTLKEQALATDWSFVPQPCIRIVGLRFSNQEHATGNTNASSVQNNTAAGAEYGQNQNNLLMTTAYKTHERPKRYFNKVLYDVSKIPFKKMRLRDYRNVHTKWKRGCYGSNLAGVPDYSSSVLRVNHYVGSFEAYMLRAADVRGRNKDTYMERLKMGTLSKRLDDSTDGWLDRFQQKVGGWEVANHLLFEPLRSENNFARGLIAASHEAEEKEKLSNITTQAKQG